MSDKTTEAEIRAHVRAAIQEHLKENSATNKPTESKQLSEVRTHIRRAINEIMVGLTPIARIDNANDANSGVDTPSAVDRADIGFNTFDMHEWASIAGITEESLNEEPEASTGDDTMLGGNDSDKRPTITHDEFKKRPEPYWGSVTFDDDDEADGKDKRPEGYYPSEEQVQDAPQTADGTDRGSGNFETWNFQKRG